MKPTHVLFAVVALTLGWEAGVLSASRQAILPPPPATAQTIRIEPVDAVHLRLRLEGREAWVVDAGGLTLTPTMAVAPGGAVRLIAEPGPIIVSVPGASRAVDRFELGIAPSGALSFSGSSGLAR